MGIRSHTYVIEKCKVVDKEQKVKELKRTICKMYKQFDGYPEGYGKDLAEFLVSKKLVNGISGDPQTCFNGAGCLAAWIVAHFKTEAGGYYMTTPDRSGGVDYSYDIIVNMGNYHDGNFSITLIVRRYKERKPLFEGTPEDFLNVYLPSRI